MSKLAQYLAQHLEGEVLEHPGVLNYFSVDGSIFTLKPRLAVYPAHETDVRKILKFGWQIAEKGQYLPITPRGKGTDQAGAAIGEGIIMVLPAHLNKLIGFDKTDVVVQPGMLYGDLQRTLNSHGRFLPPYPSSMDFSTLGGAIANNASGEKSVKYGSTKNYVKGLKMVLADGQVIEARKLSAKELNRKKGQTNLEGQIYRQLDGLLEDNDELIRQAQRHVSKNAAGYSLEDIKSKDGGFDLTKLIVGSQGTLGVVTEATFDTEAYNPTPDMLTAWFDDIAKSAEAVQKLQVLKPSAIELVDRNLLEVLRKDSPAVLEAAGIGEVLPEIVLLVEFDDASARARDHKAKRAHKILESLATERRIIPNYLEQGNDWKLRRSAAAVMSQDKGAKKALPIIEDGVVPLDKMPEFLAKVYALFKRHHLDIAVWGHAGDANFHMQPFLDLGNVGDRQKVFKLMDEFYAMVIALGGSTSGEHNDGRLRGSYLKELYGGEMYHIFEQVKKIFDPYNILNPGVKIGVERDKLLGMLRNEYSMPHLYDHLPNPS